MNQLSPGGGVLLDILRSLSGTRVSLSKRSNTRTSLAGSPPYLRPWQIIVMYVLSRSVLTYVPIHVTGHEPAAPWMN